MSNNSFRSKIAIAALAILLSGCAAIAERRAGFDSRHPCGNVLDICPGDSKIIDAISRTLNGSN